MAITIRVDVPGQGICTMAFNPDKIDRLYIAPDKECVIFFDDGSSCKVCRQDQEAVAQWFMEKFVEEDIRYSESTKEVEDEKTDS